MKITPRWIVCFLVLWAAGPVYGQYWGDRQSSRSISVSGEAAVKVVPDEVVLVLGVETDDKDLEVAKAENDERVGAALAITQRHGIPTEKVSTDYLNAQPRWDTQRHDRIFLGYWVRRTLVVTLQNLPIFDDLLSDLLSAGVTHVHDIEFRTTELRKHRDEARRLAAIAAREKAEALARELGAQLGEVTSIREERAGSWSGYGSRWGRRWDTSGMQNTISYSGSSKPAGLLSPGEISVEATVNATFLLFTRSPPASP